MNIHETALIVYASCVIIYGVLMIAGWTLKIQTSHYMIMNIYRNWVAARFRDKNLNTAIQALRNIVMGNTAYISALIILLGILVGLNETGLLRDEPVLFAIKGFNLGKVQLTICSFLVIFCLINFILAIRMMNRVALLMCAFSEKEASENISSVPELPLIERAFFSGQNHLVLGIRGIFYMAPAMSWIVNPYLFMISSLSVTVYLIFFHDLKIIR